MRLTDSAPVGVVPAWCLNLYPDAGEAGGCYRSRRPRRASERPGDPERARAEAARRARGKARRYCAANRLNRLGTLTYAERCEEPRLVRAHVGGFFREIRKEVGEAFPYLWTAQLHPGGHGFHAHFAVGRYIKQGAIKRAWGRGHVHIKLLGGLPTGSGVVQEARQASRYLAKYVSKDDDGGRPLGLHRYEVAQGFQPDEILVYGYSADDVIRRASGYMDQAPVRVWRSDEEEAWEGPPAVWVEWANGR